MKKLYGDGGSIESQNRHMLMNQAIEFKHHAEELIKAIGKNTKIDAWVVAKAERATTDLSDITHYLEGRSKKFKWGGMTKAYADGGNIAEFNFESFINYISSDIQEEAERNNLIFDEDDYAIRKKGSKVGYMPTIMFKGEGEKVDSVVLSYFDGREKLLGTIDIDLDMQEINMRFPEWRVYGEDSAKYEEGGEIEEGVDLFDDYENIPPKVQRILDKYSEDFEDGSYEGMGNALQELNQIGYTFDYYVSGDAYDLRKIGQKGKSEGNPMMEKGGLTGDVHSLTDKLLSQKIQIFLDKIKPIKYYYIDEKSNSLIVGLDGNYKQDAADKLYREATSSMELFDADSVDMEYFPKTKDTQYIIKLKKPVKFASGGMMAQGGGIKKEWVAIYVNEQKPNERKVISASGSTKEEAIRNARMSEGYYGIKKPFELFEIFVKEDSTPKMAQGGEIRYKVKGNNFSAQIENGREFKKYIERAYNNQSDSEKQYPLNFITEVAYTGKIVKNEGSNYLKDYSYKGTLTKFAFLDDADFIKALSYLDRPAIRKMEDGGRMAMGGKVTFQDKVDAISRRLQGTKVPARLEKDYGKRYNAAESKLAARRIAGSMRKKGY